MNKWIKALVILIVLFFIFVPLVIATKYIALTQLYDHFVSTISNLTGINQYLINAGVVLLMVPLYFGIKMFFSIHRERRFIGISLLVAFLILYNIGLYQLTKDVQFSFSDGRTMKWYALTPDGVKFYDRSGVEPVYGIQLKPVTPEVIRQLKLIAKGEFNPVDPEKATWFNPTTGDPQIWYYQSAGGNFEFFNKPGYHPLTGEPLKPVNKQIHFEWLEKRKKGELRYSGKMDNSELTQIPTPANMVLIQARSFRMGDAIDGRSWAMPVHTVTMSAFYLDKCEVTKALWDEVYSWATAHGYSFENAGSGTAANHPVREVSWYDVVKWLNARSEKEGRTPVYYTNLAQTTIFKMGSATVTNDMVKWMANGYRLPTEAEWEYAARGGTTTRFYTGNCISTDQANYNGHSPWTGCPSGQARGGTMAVGSFAANPWGLYDMAGNVWEYTWDWYGDYSSSAVTNPRGPHSGSDRVVRGGCWESRADTLRSAGRGIDHESDGFTGMRGFRSALSQPSGNKSERWLSDSDTYYKLIGGAFADFKKGNYMNLKQYEGELVSVGFGNRAGNFTVKGGDGPKDFFVIHEFFTYEGDQNRFPIEGSRYVVFYVITGSGDNSMQAIGLNLSKSK